MTGRGRQAITVLDADGEPIKLGPPTFDADRGRIKRVPTPKDWSADTARRRSLAGSPRRDCNCAGSIRPAGQAGCFRNGVCFGNYSCRSNRYTCKRCGAGSAVNTASRLRSRSPSLLWRRLVASHRESRVDRPGEDRHDPLPRFGRPSQPASTRQPTRVAGHAQKNEAKPCPTH